MRKVRTWFLRFRGLFNKQRGVSSSDLLTLGSVVALIFVAALIACWFPARRAARVNPMVALHCR